MKRLTLIAILLFAAMMIALCAAGGKDKGQGKDKDKEKGKEPPCPKEQLCCCRGCKRKVDGRWLPLNNPQGGLRVRANKLIVTPDDADDTCREACTSGEFYILSEPELNDEKIRCNPASNQATTIEEWEECPPVGR